MLQVIFLLFHCSNIEYMNANPPRQIYLLRLDEQKRRRRRRCRRRRLLTRNLAAYLHVISHDSTKILEKSDAHTHHKYTVNISCTEAW